MAISSLSTIAATAFKGGAGLTGTNTTSLRGRLNTVIAKVNELIAGLSDGSLDTLVVGTSGGGAYYGTSDSWMSIDGTNPPTFARIRLQDEATGGYREVRINSGALAVV